MTYESAMERGDFDGAIAVLKANLAAGDDAAQRFMLVQTLAIADRFAEALTELDAVVAALPAPAGAGFAELAGVLAADAKRTGRLTNVELARSRISPTGAPTPHALLLSKAFVLHAAGDRSGASETLAQAKAATTPLVGTVVYASGRRAAFSDLRDSDGLLATNLEVVVAGKPSTQPVLLDLDLARCRSVLFLPPGAYQDTLWPLVQVTTLDGDRLSGRAFARYAGSAAHTDPHVRLGRMTMWEDCGTYRLGRGQRDFEITTTTGHSLSGIGQIRAFEFGAPSASENTDKPEKPRGFLSRLFGR